jgi:hypothetical protein
MGTARRTMPVAFLVLSPAAPGGQGHLTLEWQIRAADNPPPHELLLEVGAFHGPLTKPCNDSRA